VSVLLMISGLGLLLLPGLSQPVGRRLVPSTWSWICLVALVGGTLMIEGLFLLYAAPTVLRAIGIPGLAALCQHMLNVLVPGGPILGWLGAGAAFIVTGGMAIAVGKYRRITRLVRVGCAHREHRAIGSCDLVVLPTEAVMAVSIAGSPPQVIVSEGLVDMLSDEEFAAVLSHESAHLAHNHHRFLTFASAIEHGFCCLPLIRRSTHALRTGIERWADEEAIAASPEGRTCLRSALVKVTSSFANSMLPAFSGPETLVERLSALRDDSPRQTPLSLGLILVPGSLLGGTGTVAMGTTFATIWTVIAAAGHCPL
jgi:hypothetical protein